MATVGADPGRLRFAAAAVIVGYALVVAVISGRSTSGDLGPPETIPSPVRLFAMLVLPAIIATIGALRPSRPLLIAAGVLCLAQSSIAFSGVTIPFVVPAILLLAVGARGGDRPEAFVTSNRASVSAIVVVVLGFAMWVAPFALTETTCWIARTGADGSLVYSSIPVADTGTLGLDDVASGCDGGSVTVQGAALAGIFGVGSVAAAVVGSGLAAGDGARPRIA